MTLNRKKCEFRTNRISFFGVIFSDSGISPDPEKVKAIKEFGKPQNVKDLRSFLGMTNYSSRFIKDYADICQPLRELTHKDKPWNWNSRCEEAFHKLKDSLCSDDVIAYYDPRRPVTVRVDASPVGLGAILLQDNDRVVCYASRALTPVESRYSQTEREALAITWACEHFDLYRRGLYHFTVITDHKPLETIWQKSRPPLRIERWGLRLQPYKFTIKYSPGKENMADYMSRHPVACTSTQNRNWSEEYVNFIAFESLPRAMELDDVKRATINDITLQKAIEFTRTGNWHTRKDLRPDDVDVEELTAISSVREELTVHSDNLLLHGTRIVFPKALRDKAIYIAHEGHQGMAKTKAFLRSKVWFPHMDGRVENRIANCAPCQLLVPERHAMEPLQMSELPGGPWENLSMDFCGPLPTGEYLFVMVDEYSRYPIVEIVKSVSARSTIPVLDKVISTFGIPRVIKSDNGSPFQSHEFKTYAEHMGFIHRRITPRWPRANAQAESFNKPLMKAVRAATINGLNWRQELFKFLRIYRATPHVSTGRSPFELIFGRIPRTRLPAVTKRVESPTDLQVRERDSHRKYQMKSYADRKNHANQKNIAVGDTVILKRESHDNKLSAKYKAEPKMVTNKKGTMITVDGKVTRNVSQFKKIGPNVQAELVKKSRDDEEVEINVQTQPSVLQNVLPATQPDVLQNAPPATQPNILQNVPPAHKENAVPNVPRRSQRNRELPKKLKDYVLCAK